MTAFTKGINPQYRVYESAWVNAINKILDNELTTCEHCGKRVNKYAPICMYCFQKLPEVKRAEEVKPEAKEVHTGVGLLIFENDKRTKILSTAVGNSYKGEDVSDIIGNMDKFATIVCNPANPDIRGIKNETDITWKCTKQDGTRFEVMPGASMVLRHRNKFVISTDQGKVGVCVYDFDR